MNIKGIVKTTVAMALAFVIAGCGAGQTNSAETGTEGTMAGQPKQEIARTIPGGLQGKKSLVVYYSWSGHTKAVAEQIHEEVGGDIIELQPEKPYPTDYRECVDIAKQELEANARPAVATKVDNLDQYDVIFVGYPIWWGKAPMFVYTFLEQGSFEGKTIVPFCTSGGSPIDGSIPDIQASAKGAIVVQGIESTDSQVISQWLQQIQAKA